MYDALTEASEEDYIPAEQFTAPSNKKGYVKPKHAPVGKAKPSTEKKAKPKAKNKSRLNQTKLQNKNNTMEIEKRNQR